MIEASQTQILGALLAVVTAVASGINIFVSLRLAALQSKMKADGAALEVSLVKQFVAWKDEVLSAINGKYVSAALIAEIRASIGRELAQIEVRLDRIEERCEQRPKECLALRCHLTDQ